MTGHVVALFLTPAIVFSCTTEARHHAQNTATSSQKDHIQLPKEEFNILHWLGLPDQQEKFFAELNEKREWMKTVVIHHLGLKSPG